MESNSTQLTPIATMGQEQSIGAPTTMEEVERSGALELEDEHNMFRGVEA